MKDITRILKKAKAELVKNIGFITNSVALSKRASESRQRQALTNNRKKVTADVDTAIKNASMTLAEEFKALEKELDRIHEEVKVLVPDGNK